MVVIIPQYVNVANQHIVYLKFTQCGMSIASQFKKGVGGEKKLGEKKKDFLGSPAVKIPLFPCRGWGLLPGWDPATKILQERKIKRLKKKLKGSEETDASDHIPVHFSQRNENLVSTPKSYMNVSSDFIYKSQKVETTQFWYIHPMENYLAMERNRLVTYMQQIG